MKSDQEPLWKGIPASVVLFKNDHNICDHDMELQEEKQFFCNCPFKEELHYGFSDRFYNEEAKPWYRCNACETSYC